ncbi:MAG: metallophosphoesterase [Armatimonadetes bacterium]|nr:metallophosphoesterase [Armatimonadota bacterium]
MRYGLISDIHANLHALDAVLHALHAEGVDAYLCAGDLVGYGPFPNECVDRLAELGATCVAGNHDLIALGLLSDDRCIPLAQRSLRWTRDELRDDTRQFLQALPRRVEIEAETVLAHGSLDDPQEYVTRPAQAEQQLRQLTTAFPAARRLVLGHTHRQWHFTPGWTVHPATSAEPAPQGPVLINPGSVGQSRDRSPNARFGILDLETGDVLLRAVAYDAAACRDALRSRGLSPASCHLNPSRAARLTGRLQRLFGAAVSAVPFPSGRAERI